MDAFLFYVFACFALLAGIMVIRAKNPVYSVLFLILVFCNVSGILLLLNLDFFAMVFLVVYVGAIAVLFLFVVMMLNVKLSEINDNILRYLPVGGIFGLLFLGQIVLVLEQDLLPIVAYHAQNVLPWIEYVSIISVFFAWSTACILWISISQPWIFFSVISQWQMHWKNLQTHLNTYASSVCLDVPTLDDVYYVIWPHSLEQTTTIQTLGHVVYTYYMVFFLLASIVLLIAMIGSIVLTMHKGVLVKRQDVFEQNTRDFSKTLHKIKSL
jgi:NADH:ubiquinone oxidoreductase subunit 6 (subunit J)